MISGFLSRELGLKLHPRKIHLTDVGKGVRFLGAVVKPYQRYVCCDGLSRTLAVQPDAVRVMVFSFYDFPECHKKRGAARLWSRA